MEVETGEAGLLIWKEELRWPTAQAKGPVLLREVLAEAAAEKTRARAYPALLNSSRNPARGLLFHRAAFGLAPSRLAVWPGCP